MNDFHAKAMTLTKTVLNVSMKSKMHLDIECSKNISHVKISIIKCIIFHRKLHEFYTVREIQKRSWKFSDN